jgi:myo-inositol 2-dehydrogenase / D-chiro-inositol 1-dehydrogenase
VAPLTREESPVTGEVNMDLIRYGVSGVGAIALRSHIPVLNMMDDVRIVALYNPSRQNAEKGAALCRERPDLVDRYEDLLDRPDVDCVLIASPNFLHKEQTVGALAAEKHVLCEKPMATSYEDALAVHGAAKTAGTVYQVGLEMRYSNFYSRLAEIVHGGQIGSPRMLTCKEFRWPFMAGSRGWRFDTHRSGGALVEMNCHHFDLFNWLSGSRPVRVFASGGNDVNTDGMLDNAFVIVEYANGVRACLAYCKFSAYGNDIIELTVIGDKGKLDSSASNHVICQWGAHTPDRTVYTVAMDPSFGDLERQTSQKDRWVLWERSMVYRQHRAFIRCIREGKRPLADADVALQSTLVPLAATRSLETREAVSLPPV